MIAEAREVKLGLLRGGNAGDVIISGRQAMAELKYHPPPTLTAWMVRS